MTKIANKNKLKEVGIFPNSCETGHNFVPFRDNVEDHVNGYYKRNARGDAISSTVYTTLFCTKCGETKEIAIVKIIQKCHLTSPKI